MKIDDLLNTTIDYKSKSIDIETILLNMKRGYFDIPDWQRKYVWEKEQVENLILSLIRNIPIPPIYLYYNKSNGNYVVLDGQQRLTSVFMYYNSIFYKDKSDRPRINFKNISETNLHDYNMDKTDYSILGEDITFDKLDELYKKVLLRKDLDIVFINDNSSNSNLSYAEIFKLINISGVPMSYKELQLGVDMIINNI